jgi:hypothetical protein
MKTEARESFLSRSRRNLSLRCPSSRAVAWYVLCGLLSGLATTTVPAIAARGIRGSSSPRTQSKTRHTKRGGNLHILQVEVEPVGVAVVVPPESEPPSSPTPQAQNRSAQQVAAAPKIPDVVENKYLYVLFQIRDTDVQPTNHALVHVKADETVAVVTSGFADPVSFQAKRALAIRRVEIGSLGGQPESIVTITVTGNNVGPGKRFSARKAYFRVVPDTVRSQHRASGDGRPKAAR